MLLGYLEQVRFMPVVFTTGIQTCAPAFRSLRKLYLHPTQLGHFLWKAGSLFLSHKGASAKIFICSAKPQPIRTRLRLPCWTVVIFLDKYAHKNNLQFSSLLSSYVWHRVYVWQDALGPDRVHSTSTVATADVKLLTMNVKDLERTLHAKDFQNLIKLVGISEQWRKSHVQKALTTVNATKEIAENPDASVKAKLRLDAAGDELGKNEHPTFTLGDNMLAVLSFAPWPLLAWVWGQFTDNIVCSIACSMSLQTSHPSTEFKEHVHQVEDRVIDHTALPWVSSVTPIAMAQKCSWFSIAAFHVIISLVVPPFEMNEHDANLWQ